MLCLRKKTRERTGCCSLPCGLQSLGRWCGSLEIPGWIKGNAKGGCTPVPLPQSSPKLIFSICWHSVKVFIWGNRLRLLLFFELCPSLYLKHLVPMPQRKDTDTGLMWLPGVFHLQRTTLFKCTYSQGCQALISLPLIVRNFTYQERQIPHRLALPLKTHFKGLAQLSGLNGWFGTIANNRGRQIIGSIFHGWDKEWNIEAL